MTSDNRILGTVSLMAAIAGVVAPASLVVAAILLYPVGDRGRPLYVAAGLLFVTLETAAVVCGRLGRRSNIGKAGLSAGGGCLGVLLGTIVGAALPFGWFLIAEGGHGGPGAVVLMTYSVYAAIGAVMGGVLGGVIGVWLARATANRRPENRNNGI